MIRGQSHDSRGIFCGMFTSVIPTGAPQEFVLYTKISSAEWRDPEGVSFAVQFQAFSPHC